MLRNIKLSLLIFLLLFKIASVVHAQDIKYPDCYISGASIICGQNSLTPGTSSSTPGAPDNSLQYRINGTTFGGISGYTTNGSTSITGGVGTTLVISNATLGANVLAVGGTSLFNGSTTINTGGAGNYILTNSNGTANFGIQADGNNLIENSSSAKSIIINIGTGTEVSRFNSTGLSAMGVTITGNAAASTPILSAVGTVFTGGSGTTTFPQILIQPTGTTAVTTWSTSGTIIGANVVSGFAGNFLDFHVAGGASLFSVTSAGVVKAPAGTNSAPAITVGGSATAGLFFNSGSNGNMNVTSANTGGASVMEWYSTTNRVMWVTAGPVLNLQTGAAIVSIATTGMTIPGGANAMMTSSSTFTSGAGVATGTLTNAPSAGNPTSWIKINDNGVIRYIPAW